MSESLDATANVILAIQGNFLVHKMTKIIRISVKLNNRNYSA